MSRCTTQPNALRPRAEIFTEAVVVFALAWLKKNNNNNKKNYMVFLEHRPRVYFSLTKAVEATALFVQQHVKGAILLLYTT